MRRRDFIQLLGGAAVASPWAAAAQTTPKTFRLATLNPRAPITADSPFGSILVRELAQRGYSLGQNLAFDARGADGKMALLPQLAQELAASKVDAVVASNYPTAVALKPTGVPTVIVAGGDWPHREPGATRRQHHRNIGRGDHAHHQVSWAAQGGAAEPSQGG